MKPYSCTIDKILDQFFKKDTTTTSTTLTIITSNPLHILPPITTATFNRREGMNRRGSTQTDSPRWAAEGSLCHSMLNWALRSSSQMLSMPRLLQSSLCRLPLHKLNKMALLRVYRFSKQCRQVLTIYSCTQNVLAIKEQRLASFT
jgi:hypothetical protein